MTAKWEWQQQQHTLSQYNLKQMTQFVQMTQFEKLGEHLGMLWTNTWVYTGASKVNKTPFASDV